MRRWSGCVRFLGATLWTDYRVFGEANQAAAMNACAKGMNDHRLIGWQKKPWRDSGRRKRRCCITSPRQLGGARDGVLRADRGYLSHCGALELHSSAVPERSVTGSFVSDLAALIEPYQPTLWVHGHVHNSSDYVVGKTRVLCNPHGYGTENPDFNGALVVEVEA